MKFRAVRNDFYWRAQIWVDSYGAWYDVPDTESNTVEQALRKAKQWEGE